MRSEIRNPEANAYRSVNRSAGWADRTSRVRLEIAGPDRAKFLHNLTTNDVKRLAEGVGHEAFVTNPQGKTLAYATFLATDHSIIARTDPASLEALLPHLRKYGVFDDVAIEDRTAETFEYHVAGPEAGPLLEARGVELPPEGPLRHRTAELAGVAVRVIRESPTGRPGLALIGPSEGAEAVKAAFAGSGLVEIDEITFEAMRIEAGTPISGVDVLPNNLPQEVGRDGLAINFVKGCYLGQETVARLDALGHVNRLLRGLQFEGKIVPPVGSALTFEGKAVGSVTSSAFSRGWDAPIALAYVRVSQGNAGTKLDVTIAGSEVSAVVRDLPMLPPV